MENSNRLKLLQSFLKLYEVEKIELTNITVDSISGIAFYDLHDPEEKQEFIWHMSEKKVPPSNLNILIDRIVKEELHEGDRIFDEIEKLEFSEFNNSIRDKIINILYEIEIKMIDEGKESDSLYVHN